MQGDQCFQPNLYYLLTVTKAIVCNCVKDWCNVQDWDFKKNVQIIQTEQKDDAFQAMSIVYNGPHNWILIWEKT